MNSIELFHQYNGKRPVYFTALLFKKLEYILYSDHTCIVTGTDSNFQILLYDAKHFNPYLALDNQMNMRATEMIHLNINALEEGMYKIKHFTLQKKMVRYLIFGANIIRYMAWTRTHRLR